jgi:hypothetical protein
VIFGLLSLFVVVDELEFVVVIRLPVYNEGDEGVGVPEFSSIK